LSGKGALEMRLIGGEKLSEKEYAFIKTRLTEFHKAEKICSDRCPMLQHVTTSCLPFAPEIRRLEKRLISKSDKCICNLFDEFEVRGHENCPCRNYGKDAFRRLGQVVERLKDPDAYKPACADYDGARRSETAIAKKEV
jgi:hypothetical protein